MSDRVSLTIGAGSLVLGHITWAHGSRALGPGWLGSFSASFRVVDEKRIVPYVLLAASTSATGTVTRQRPTDEPGARGTYIGVDFRFGVTLGKTFARVFSPYIAARVFGGPVIWHERGTTMVGTDIYHFQPAIGAAFLLPAHLDLFVEGQPYFERGVSGGIGIRN
jgi:hypothetical protein